MVAYLTVDDAPSGTLDETLRVLRSRGVPALFFCEGRRLIEHPERAERAIEAGFHLGNHAFSHPHTSELSVEEFESEVAETERLIERRYDRVGRERPARVFRFPYGDAGGDRAVEFQRVLRDWEFRPPTRPPHRNEEPPPRVDWSWSFAVEDWTTDSVAELERRVAATADEDRTDPEIVLFHDAGNDPDLFGAFVDLLLERGFDLRDPMELVDADG